MNDVTRILNAMEQGDSQAADSLLPLVYDELRSLAAHRLAMEKPGQTLQATALVHEAYLRLVKTPSDSPLARGSEERQFDHRGHFFAAAAEAMRRILVESARAKQSLKRGGQFQRDRTPADYMADLQHDPLELLAIHEALDRLAAKSPRKAELVKLRYFLGCTIPEAAQLLNIAPATAEEDWTYARAWLRKQLDPEEQDQQISKKVTGG